MLSNTGHMASSITTIDASQDFRSHKTDGNKGNGKIRYSSGKNPLTGEKLPLSYGEYNGVFTFVKLIPGRNPHIVCHHFSCYVLIQRLQNNQFKIYEAFQHKAAILTNLGDQQALLDERTRNICHTADAVYILREMDWADFLNTQFACLEKGGQGDRFFCVLNTLKHTMMLEGLIGYNNQGRLFYRVKFYEPNETVHTKTIESASKDLLTHTSLRHFLSEQDYYDFQADLVMAAVYWQNNDQQLKAQPVLITEFDEIHLFDSKILPMVATWGLTSGLEHLLSLAPSVLREGMFDWLTCTYNKGKPALYSAMEYNRRETVAMWIDWLISQPISQHQTYKVLLAQAGNNTGATALHVAMSLGFNESVTVFLSGCIKAFNAKQLKLVQLITLLSHKDHHGRSALHSALCFGEDANITTFMNAVVNIPELDNVTVEAIFLARDNDGTPGVLFALQRGYAKSVEAFTNGCLAAIAKNKLTQAQFETITELLS